VGNALFEPIIAVCLQIHCNPSSLVSKLMTWHTVYCCGQLAAANECNQQLQVALHNEKLAAAATARNLEGKLADTEDCLLQKVREVAQARDVQTGLRIELDSFKTMIENEEDRSVFEI